MRGLRVASPLMNVTEVFWRTHSLLCLGSLIRTQPCAATTCVSGMESWAFIGAPVVWMADLTLSTMKMMLLIPAFMLSVSGLG